MSSHVILNIIALQCLLFLDDLNTSVILIIQVVSSVKTCCMALDFLECEQHAFKMELNGGCFRSSPSGNHTACCLNPGRAGVGPNGFPSGVPPRNDARGLSSNGVQGSKVTGRKDFCAMSMNRFGALKNT